VGGGFQGLVEFWRDWRCEPLTIRDEFSRYVLELRAMDNARSQTVREEFNEALGMRCPAELYQNSGRPYRSAEVHLSYPGMVTRLVDKNGKVSWKSQKVFLTGSLAGWEVGSKERKRSNWRSGSADSCSDTLIRRRSVS
jgi:hypothetical protein